MEPIKIKPRVIKPVKIDATPITLADESPYIPLTVETKEEAMRACLHMILKHTADMFVTITEIIAEEYKLDATEMVKTIQGSPRFEKLCAEDVLLTLGYFEAKEEVPKVEVPKVEVPKVEGPKVEGPKVEGPKVKRKPRAPKAAPEVVVPEVVQEAPVEEAPVAVPIKKVKIRIINKLNK
jgi:hypothetical protein